MIPNFKTNLKGVKPVSGDWAEENNGLVGSGSGDIFIVSSIVVADFTYEANLNGELMIDVRDSTYASGYLGFNVFYGTGVFQNATYAGTVE